MSLDAPANSGPPAAYFPNVGDAIVVAIVDVGTYHQRDYDSNELKYWPDGGKVEGKVVTGLVVSTEGDTAAGSEKAHGPVTPGDLVTFWCEGSKHFTWRDALATHGAVEVGHVMRWERIADEPPKNPRHNPRKVYVAKLRADKPEEAAQQARCEELRRELQRSAGERTELAANAAPEPAYSGDDF
jgi:hypothetical protein